MRFWEQPTKCNAQIHGNEEGWKGLRNEAYIVQAAHGCVPVRSN